MINENTVILIESGYDTNIPFTEYCEFVSQYGDDPRNCSEDVSEFTFTMCFEAEDVGPDWPEDLPVWSYKANWRRLHWRRLHWRRRTSAATTAT